MLNLQRNLLKTIERTAFPAYSTTPDVKKDNFKPLNLRHVKGQATTKRAPRVQQVFPVRSEQMSPDQDWGSVWPGPRSFHPATVPLPIRQGFTEKGAPPPAKYANAELMKIPNFLHLTPPVIKRQCEALKKFCTPWPKALNTEAKCEKYFPIEVTSSSYCHSSPTIRDPLARIVTVKFKLECLNLNERERDKMLRLVGERFDESTGTITIVTDRCPTRKQNYDYAMYLVTALYHESKKVEPWEELKSEADMEYYDWETNASKKNIEAIFGKPSAQIPKIEIYSSAVSALMNEGENEYTVNKYNEAVRELLNIPNLENNQDT